MNKSEELKDNEHKSGQALHAQFKAMAQGKADYEVDVISIDDKERGTMMCVCSEEAAIYITKEQAAKFFGFSDAVL